MNTNNVPAAANQYLQEVLKWNDTLLGLPALPLILIGCLALGLAVQVIPWISNRFYSTVVLVFAILANVLIAPLKSVGDGVRACIYALIVTVAAVVLDRKYVSKWISLKDEPTKPTTPSVGI